MTRRRLLLPWLVMAVLLASALVVAAKGQAGPSTDAQRVNRITSEIRCPTCRGLSAAESDTPAARAIRDEVSRRVQAGESNSQIYDYVESRFGSEIRLSPKPRGVGLVVWLLPIVVAAAAVVTLGLLFRRWRSRRAATPTTDDRALVDEALRS